jgi:hypothetical protein
VPPDDFVSLIDRDRSNWRPSRVAGDIAQAAVRKYAKEIEAAAKEINVQAEVASLSDMYWVLFVPNLPGADRISEELETFLDSSGIIHRVVSFVEEYKAEMSCLLESSDPTLLKYVVQSLSDDISARTSTIPTYAGNVLYMQKLMEDEIPPPPSFSRFGKPRVRSVHRWVLEAAKQAVVREMELLVWQKNARRRFAERLEDANPMKT